MACDKKGSRGRREQMKIQVIPVSYAKVKDLESGSEMPMETKAKLVMMVIPDATNASKSHVIMEVAGKSSEILSMLQFGMTHLIKKTVDEQPEQRKAIEDLFREVVERAIINTHDIKGL
jgi:hypothetical protein